MKTINYTTGQRVQVYFSSTNELFTAHIIGSCVHEGQKVYALDNLRFVYLNQILGTY